MGFNFETIENEKIEEIKSLKSRSSLISAIKKAKRDSKIAVIAEFKRASPTLGRICKAQRDPIEYARSVEDAGACAISVLTDKNFDGKLHDLRHVKKSVGIPVMRKDFIVDEFQIYESYGNGADAILLIARLLHKKIGDFVDIAHSLGLETLVEVHDEEDLDLALETDSMLIGINNRNLKTMEIDLGTTERLAPKIPKERIIISESGISNKVDLRRVLRAGADAVLVGTNIMRAENVKKAVRELVEFQELHDIITGYHLTR